MRIAVLGAGAMGSLFGACLSKTNEVLLVCRRQEAAQAILREGITIHEPDGTTGVYRPSACVDTAGERPADLVILFVKGRDSEAALSANRALLGENTLLLTLQNGGGHEEDLLRFVPCERALIGVTQQGASRLSDREVRHTGCGACKIGSLSGGDTAARRVAEAFTACGLPAEACGDVRRAVWEKLLTNASASALTGVLQVSIDRIAAVQDSWALCVTLVREAVAVAEAEGIRFDAEEEIAKVRAVCQRSVGGITSICADLAAGRPTEVEAITGTVVRAAEKNGIPAPTHRTILRLIRSMEEKAKEQR